MGRGREVGGVEDDVPSRGALETRRSDSDEVLTSTRFHPRAPGGECDSRAAIWELDKTSLEQSDLI